MRGPARVVLEQFSPSCGRRPGRPGRSQTLGPLGLTIPSTQLLDQNAKVLAIIDGHGDEMYPARGKSLAERWHERLGRSDVMALRAIGRGVFHEIGIAEGHAVIREPVDG